VTFRLICAKVTIRMIAHIGFDIEIIESCLLNRDIYMMLNVDPK